MNVKDIKESDLKRLAKWNDKIKDEWTMEIVNTLAQAELSRRTASDGERVVKNLQERALAFCYAIEKLDACPEQTNASIAASALFHAIKKYESAKPRPAAEYWRSDAGALAKTVNGVIAEHSTSYFVGTKLDMPELWTKLTAEAYNKAKPQPAKVPEPVDDEPDQQRCRT